MYQIEQTKLNSEQLTKQSENKYRDDNQNKSQKKANHNVVNLNYTKLWSRSNHPLHRKWKKSNSSNLNSSNLNSSYLNSSYLNSSNLNSSYLNSSYLNSAYLNQSINKFNYFKDHIKDQIQNKLSNFFINRFLKQDINLVRNQLLEPFRFLMHSSTHKSNQINHNSTDKKVTKNVNLRPKIYLIELLCKLLVPIKFYKCSSNRTVLVLLLFILLFATINAAQSAPRVIKIGKL